MNFSAPASATSKTWFFDDVSQQMWRRFWNYRWRQRRVRISVYYLGALLLISLIAPFYGWLWGVDAEIVDLAKRLQGPSWQHVLGTNDLGQDLFLRLLLASRLVFLVGFGSALISTIIGVFVGVQAALYEKFHTSARGWRFFVGVIDLFLAMPLLPLLLLLSLLEVRLLGFGLISPKLKMVLLLAMFGWMHIARLAYTQAIEVLGRGYSIAAEAMGASRRHVSHWHVFPHLLPSLLPAILLQVVNNILYETSLSFLGLGIQPPAPSWGNMMTNGAGSLMSTLVIPWPLVWPAFALFLTVSACQNLADDKRDQLIQM